MSLFEGLSAFPITPADPLGRVDTAALARILVRIKEAGVDSIGLLGSTGAYAFLSRDERRRAVETAVETVGGKIPIIVGVGALRTADAEALARDAQAAGADGLLLAPVSYFPLSDNEVYEHFAAVAGAGKLPLAIYNNPGTTRFTFSLDLISRLSNVSNVVAAKMPLPSNDAYAGELKAIRATTPSEFRVGYSGDWGGASSLLAGGDAWYSVVAGLLPAQALALTRAAQAGDAQGAKQIDSAFEPLWTLFKEFGSFRVMYVIADLLSLCKIDPPLPILPLRDEARRRVAAALKHLGV
ncbi:dihydrodipicolinate synthase family protein [Agrobacterium tumefaciens]|uniref:Dihydrodipicolinate synthase n=1 Tax=Agrobacterium tumefaciens TaxID=358 RepID=A0A2L2LL39_AGRTU|nr:dihydrodipicolinate synthase family protein [Agrobacterium tumefaciens]AVH45016.1 dihydrodipicolinate synthase [Agrobacterium tumefaciens]NSY98908.1 dihydrodipicolinate synthase family protein [Agrobacterium tumefaciens]